MTDKPFTQELLETIIFSLVVYAIAEVMSKPDTYKTASMAFYRAGKRFAQWQADSWQDCATAFAQAYNKARL